MVIVVEHFSEEEKVYRHQVGRGIVHLVIHIANPVRKPIDNRAMESAHYNRYRKKSPLPGCGNQLGIDQHVQGNPGNPYSVMMRKGFKSRPVWNTLFELFIYRDSALPNTKVRGAGLPHHVENVAVISW